MVMLVLSFLGWWYGSGWSGIVGSLNSRSRSILSEFSVVQLLRTLFSPWRRIISYPGANIAERWHAWLDNLVSRIIGFIVRLLVLLAATLVLIGVIVITILQIVIWPLLPVGVIGCLVVSLA
jgi:hypothetical protein